MEKEEKSKEEGIEEEELEVEGEVVEEEPEVVQAEVEVEKEPEEGLKSEEYENLMDSYLRLKADFMNYKNRAKKDKESTIAYATEDLINQILPILDNFERALETGDKEDGFYKGVKMIYDQLVEVLKNNGLEEIQCLGEAFDPNFHNGILVEECKDEKEGTILDVLQKGYTLNGKVIRPTMVKIAG